MFLLFSNSQLSIDSVSVRSDNFTIFTTVGFVSDIWLVPKEPTPKFDQYYIKPLGVRYKQHFPPIVDDWKIFKP